MDLSYIIKIVLAISFLIYACFYLSQKTPPTSEEYFANKKKYSNEQLLDFANNMFRKIRTLKPKKQ